MKENHQTQEHLSRLQGFRQHLYALFDHRRDGSCELLDALVQTPSAHSFAELSLAPACRRRWPSLYKTLAQAPFDDDGWRRLCLRQLPQQAVCHGAVAGMATRRRHSPTLRDRRFCHGAQREVNGQGVIVGLPYSILAWVERRASSWAPALHTRRVQTTEKAVAVAAQQCQWLAENLAAARTADVALDGAYGNLEFFSQMRGVALLAVARMRHDRVLFRRPAPPAGQKPRPGRPAKYGAAFRFADSTTWPPADAVLELDDATYGKAQLQMWQDLRFRVKQEVVAIAVVRCQIHADQPQPPQARWYGVHNGSTEETRLAEVFACLTHRWPIEPANRFRKERLYAALPKVREARQSDLWMLLVQLVEWELWLWREIAKDERMAWQKPLPQDQLTPGRVLRCLKENLLQLGSPVSKVLRRGKSPGWPKHKVRKRPPKYFLESKSRKRRLQMSKNE